MIVNLYVALLAEGVGRNQNYQALDTSMEAVALLAEGVGRNGFDVNQEVSYLLGRPPRGGRG